MVLHYSSKVGIIRGSVKSPKQTLTKPVYVIIAAQPDRGPASVWIEPTDQALNFAVKDRKPGTYFILLLRILAENFGRSPRFWNC